MAARKKNAFDDVADAAKAFVEEHGDSIPAPDVMYLSAVIKSIQLHKRAHVFGLPGTSDILNINDHILSIHVDTLGPVAGFVVTPRRGTPVFIPASAVLAVGVGGD